jgi:hypothetical protein
MKTEAGWFFFTNTRTSGGTVYAANYFIGGEGGTVPKFVSGRSERQTTTQSEEVGMTGALPWFVNAIQ